MRKEDVEILSSILGDMKESISRMEKAKIKKNAEEILRAKTEILNLQKKADKIL